MWYPVIRGSGWWVQIEPREHFIFWIYKFLKTHNIAIHGEGILGPLVNIPRGPAQMDLRFFFRINHFANESHTKYFVSAGVIPSKKNSRNFTVHRNPGDFRINPFI